MNAVVLTDGNFEAEVLQERGVVLVDFFASWCGPCKTQAPIVEAMAQAFKGRAKVGKLDVDQNQKTAERFEIMSVPSLIIFQDGRIKETLTGVQAENVLREKISHLL